MRGYELTDFERSVIAPLLPDKPRGVSRADARRVLNGIFESCEQARRGGRCPGNTARRQPATNPYSIEPVTA